MEQTRSEDKAKERLNELIKDPAIEHVRDSIGHLPIWAMTGGALSFFLVDYALKTNRIAPKSPRLARFGMVALGVFGGVQAGLWKIRHDYMKLDPKGEKINEFRGLLTDLAKNRSDGSCPKSVLTEVTRPNVNPTTTADISHIGTRSNERHDRLPRINKYGDVIEEDK